MAPSGVKEFPLSKLFESKGTKSEVEVASVAALFLTAICTVAVSPFWRTAVVADGFAGS